MARIIEPPDELEIVCKECDAKIGYSKIDIQKSEGMNQIMESFIECPNDVCGAKVFVPKWEAKKAPNAPVQPPAQKEPEK
jgi:hypothetical protein